MIEKNNGIKTKTNKKHKREKTQKTALIQKENK